MGNGTTANTREASVVETSAKGSILYASSSDAHEAQESQSVNHSDQDHVDVFNNRKWSSIKGLIHLRWKC